jgi:Nucleotidyltransferase domain
VDTGEAVLALIGGHPLVGTMRLTGSRADGTAHELSDWDFLVTTYDFPRLAADLPRAVHPLQPLAQQWDRYSDHACYMLMLPGPTKVDLIFPDRKQAWAPPWEPSAETLAPIDAHFWDWIHWLEQKRRAGRTDALAKGLGDMYDLMLGPMGAKEPPASVDEAVEVYLALRDQLEERYGVNVPRKLENAVRPVLS